jgi:hypothetical protein
MTYNDGSSFQNIVFTERETVENIQHNILFKVYIF